MNLRCRRWRGLIGAALDGELSGERAVRLERHIASCPACAAQRDALLRLREVLRGGLEAPVSDAALGSYEARVWERIAALRGGADGRRAAALPPRAGRLLPRLAFATAVVAAAAAVWFVLPGHLEGAGPTRVNYVYAEEGSRYAVMVAGGDGYSAVWFLDASGGAGVGEGGDDEAGI